MHFSKKKNPPCLTVLQSHTPTLKNYPAHISFRLSHAVQICIPHSSASSLFSCAFSFLPFLLLVVFISPRTLLLSTVVAVTVTPAPPTVPPSYRCTLLALLPRCCIHIRVPSCQHFHPLMLVSLFMSSSFFSSHCPNNPIIPHLCILYC